MSGRLDRSRRSYAPVQIVAPARAAECSQCSCFLQLLISSHARLPVSWDISGCVLLNILVDTFVREVSRDLPATSFLPRRSC